MKTLLVVPLCALVLALPRIAPGQGLPPVPAPAENPITPEKALLGKILYWEEQLSGDNTMSCGTCHQPSRAGGDPRNGLPISRHAGPDGIMGTSDDVQGASSIIRCDPAGNYFDDGVFWPRPLVVPRKTQGFMGHQWDSEMFWDGRFGDVLHDEQGQVVIASGGALELQAVLVPPSGTMNCQSWTWGHLELKLQYSRPLRLASNLGADIQAALAAHPDYPSLFAWAFGDPAITRERFGMAVATYERTLIPDQTPYDAFVAGNPNALTPAQQNGLQVFNSVGCASCHTPPLFTNHGYHNIGVRPASDDMGRFIATGDPADRGKFKTTSLRSAAVRAPYFHNGRVDTLHDVVLFYERGGDFHDNIDPAMTPFTLTTQDRDDLVDFLANGLLDPRVPLEQAPFDRPTLHSEIAPNPELIGVGSPGAGAHTPLMVANIPPMIGSYRFGVGVAHALGGAQAFLAIAAAPAPMGSFAGSLPVYVDPTPLPLLLPTQLGGPAGVPGRGYGSVMTLLDDSPLLNGIELWVQWVIVDPNVPAGLSVSEGAHITFFAP